jgi:N-methylhydantoinase B
VRVVTTGGGGWGDPLEREPEWVQRDVIEGKVSLAAARDDYGAVLHEADGKDPFVIEEAATAALRAQLKTARKTAAPMIDRGDGYDKMQRGEFKPWVRSA